MVRGPTAACRRRAPAALRLLLRALMPAVRRQAFKAARQPIAPARRRGRSACTENDYFKLQDRVGAETGTGCALRTRDRKIMDAWRVIGAVSWRDTWNERLLFAGT